MGAMPSVRSGLKREGFFEKNRFVSSPAAIELLAVGGKGDNAFRAFAAALLDQLISGRLMQSETVRILLDKHFDFFPHHRSNLLGLQTPAERVQRLIAEVSMPELLQSLAYTFRQLAVDELLRMPEKYREAFFNRYNAYDPEIMRCQNVQLDKSAIAALAYALRIPLLLKIIDNAKTLPLCLHYNYQEEKTKIVLQLHDGQYVPELSHAERFRTAVNRPVTIAPVEKEGADPVLDEILAKIAADDEAIYEEFVAIRDRLMAMVNAGELTKEDLINTYIKTLPANNMARGAKYIGTEHGSEDFFATIKQSLNETKATAFERVSPEDSLSGELIQAIARAISCGQAPKEAAFEHIDDLKVPAAKRLMA